jgi:hypothetical protein
VALTLRTHPPALLRYGKGGPKVKKIVSLFQRNYDGDGLVRDELVPGAEWVAAGEGKATRKFDGTCCMVRDGRLYKRYDAKNGKAPPADFEPSQEPDPVTGHWPGWVPVTNAPEDQWFREAAKVTAIEMAALPPDGTYECCGPKINGNREGLEYHVLISHGSQECPGCPVTFDGLRDFFTANDDIEGVVWHHPDGRMVKIKARDFGIKRRSAAPIPLEVAHDL